MDSKVAQIAEGFMREAAEDYVGLWAIAPAVKRDLRLTNDEEVKARTLDVVRVLLSRGLLPGDYLKTGFHLWPERDPHSIMVRIEKEWASRGAPILGDESCWFSRNK